MAKCNSSKRYVYTDNWNESLKIPLTCFVKRLRIGPTVTVAWTLSMVVVFVGTPGFVVQVVLCLLHGFRDVCCRLGGIGDEEVGRLQLSYRRKSRGSRKSAINAITGNVLCSPSWRCHCKICDLKWQWLKAQGLKVNKSDLSSSTTLTDNIMQS